MKAALKSWLKIIARALATVVLLPEFLSFALRSFLLGRDRALEGSSQTLALVPGIVGQYLRRAFLTWVLDYCHPSVTVEFGTIFSKAAARLEENVYIGPRCHLGWVFIERDVLIAAGVHIPSGPLTHGTDDTGTPIREQTGTLRMVRIGARSWIGSAAVVMADVGRDSVVGAGAVVTKPIADRVFAAGVPARVVRSREPQQTPNTIYEIGNLSK
jgi:acetyltransferase-like isoleucine patch superfamily enzyme